MRLNFELVKIEFLYTDDCSVAARLYPRAVEAVGGEIHRVDLTSIPFEDPRRRYNSGTILIDGTDLFGQEPSPTPILNPN